MPIYSNMFVRTYIIQGLSPFSIDYRNTASRAQPLPELPTEKAQKFIHRTISILMPTCHSHSAVICVAINHPGLPIELPVTLSRYDTKSLWLCCGALLMEAGMPWNLTLKQCNYHIQQIQKLLLYMLFTQNAREWRYKWLRCLQERGMCGNGVVFFGDGTSRSLQNHYDGAEGGGYT